MVTRDEIVNQARNYIGVKWKHQGRNPKTGLDCAGLVVAVAHDLELSDYDFVNYQRRPGHEFVKHFSMNMRSKPIKDRAIGDVLLFREGVHSCHCGIITSKNGLEYFVHGYSNFSKISEEHLSPRWISKVSHCFEFYRID